MGSTAKNIEAYMHAKKPLSEAMIQNGVVLAFAFFGRIPSVRSVENVETLNQQRLSIT